MSYATTRHTHYKVDVESANDYFRHTGDLKGFQALNTKARETWHADVRAHYNNDTLNSDLREALTQGGRVYATLDTGELIRIHNVGNLYDVSDLSPEPLISRMVGNFSVKHTRLEDIISRA